eukprot:TRINITY_DN9037_c0_g2_i1.p1 TRINITY_DN9037_c0_g2~~TRINITY_DN9037_c0_g2_i1.p1  ORF type:complete len:315 (+),score=50.67 TRINITY_DN9037_c0_g2_i1:59-1003(+)
MFASLRSCASLRHLVPALPVEDIDELRRGGLSAIVNTLNHPPEADEDEAPAKLVLFNRHGKQLGPTEVSVLSKQSVLLHVYDVRREIQVANRCLAPSIGGAFHVGVECFGIEWSYGVCGVCADPARTVTGHAYHCSIYLGRTALDPAAFSTAVLSMCERWRGAEYQIIGHNCCNFADSFCARLGVFSIPTWVSRLPRLLKARKKARREALATRAPERQNVSTNLVAVQHRGLSALALAQQQETSLSGCPFCQLQDGEHDNRSIDEEDSDSSTCTDSDESEGSADPEDELSLHSWVLRLENAELHRALQLSLQTR